MVQISTLGGLQTVSLSKLKGLFIGGLNLKKPQKSIDDGDSPDLWNVEFTKGNAIKGRDFIEAKGTLPDDPDNAGTPIIPRQSYSFIDVNEVNWYVLSNNKYHFISDDLTTWTNINPSNPNNILYTTRMTFINGKLYGTNGIDDVWSYDISGPTFATHSGIPKGRYIWTHNGRLVMGNVPGKNNYILYSNLDDETNFYHPVKTTIINEFKVETDTGGQITGGKSYRQKLIIFTAFSISVWSGFDDRDFIFGNLSQQYGCANNETVQEFNGFVVFLGADGNFYKTDARNIAPIGDKIEPGLKDKMPQVYTYQESFFKHGTEGATKWANNGLSASEWILPSAGEYNDEPNLTPGMLANFGQSGVGVRNSLFNSGEANWTKHATWDGGSRQIPPNGGGAASWGVSGAGVPMSVRTEYTTETFLGISWTSHVTNVAKVELIFVDESGTEIGGVRLNANTFVQRNGFPYPAFQHYNWINIGNINTSYYDDTWGEWQPADIAYRKLSLRMKIFRSDFTLPFGGNTPISEEDGGYTYVDCDAGYIGISGTVSAKFMVSPIGITDEKFEFDAMGGFQNQSSTATSWYYSDEMDIADVDRFGAFYVDIDNRAGSTMSYEYRIFDEATSTWSPNWTAISPGGNISSGALNTPIKIQFRISSFNATDPYEVIIINYIGFYFYTKNDNLPDIDCNMTSLVYDGKYFCSMAVYEMGVWNNLNNVTFILDEYSGRERWSRWDPKIETVGIYANKPIMWNREGGFVFNPTKQEMSSAEYISFNCGMPFYYRTKDWDFGIIETMKRWKYITYKIDCLHPRKNPEQYPFFHIEHYVDEQYSGTWQNYILNKNLTPHEPTLYSNKILTRVAKTFFNKPYSTIKSIYPEWDIRYGYPLGDKKVIGFGNDIGMKFFFATIMEDNYRIIRLKYDIIEMDIYMEVKDYMPQQLYKDDPTTEGIRSEQNI